MRSWALTPGTERRFRWFDRLGSLPSTSHAALGPLSRRACPLASHRRFSSDARRGSRQQDSTSQCAFLATSVCTRRTESPHPFLPGPPSGPGPERPHSFGGGSSRKRGKTLPVRRSQECTEVPLRPDLLGSGCERYRRPIDQVNLPNRRSPLLLVLLRQISVVRDEIARQLRRKRPYRLAAPAGHERVHRPRRKFSWLLVFCADRDLLLPKTVAVVLVPGFRCK
jgi:hypothetical protein